MLFYYILYLSGRDLLFLFQFFCSLQELQWRERQIELDYECSQRFVCHPYISKHRTNSSFPDPFSQKNPILLLQHIKTMCPAVAEALLWDVLPAFGPCHPARKVAKTSSLFFFSLLQMFYTHCVTVTLMPQRFGVIVRICGGREGRIRQT